MRPKIRVNPVYFNRGGPGWTREGLPVPLTKLTWLYFGDINIYLGEGIMKKITFLCCFAFFAACARAQEFDPQPIKNEISKLEQTIVKAKADSAKYAGGLVKALLDSRIEIYEHTKAMLEQRLAAGNNRIALKYTMDGKEYVPPADKAKIVLDLENEASSVTKEIEAAQKDADRYSGGLVLAMKLSTVATLQQQFAMIEMKRSALVFDIPLYAFWGKVAPPVSVQQKEQPKGTPAEIDGMFDVKLTGKHVFEANYSDHLGFDFAFSNHTDKDIKAVKGIAYFTDLFDIEFHKISFTMEKAVPAGKSINNSDYSIDLNKFDEKDNRLRSIGMDNLKFRFKVLSIIFKDGSIVNR
jgi:hypothetical protein